MNASVLTGRAFRTRVAECPPSTWAPLEAVARLARSRVELPAFHEGEFMYIAGLSARRGRVRIHLYKHCDTRCSLNLDERGHAYRSITDAVAQLDLWLVEGDTPLHRSFPPAAWPPDHASR
jgi:hypothetical protein